MAVPRYRAQLATLVGAAPRGAAWIHEIKYDGYRIGCRVEGGRIALVSRRGQDWTRRFPEVVEAVAALRVRDALLDGEVAAVLPDGRTSFQDLQNALARPPPRGLAYFVFDLLHLDGDDLARRPLEERKAALARLLARAPGPVLRYADPFEGEGPEVWREACRLGVEGIVSKRRDRPYRPGRNPEWQKAKCAARQELVVGGFTDEEGSASDLGALLVGYHRPDGTLAYAGKVGAGFGARADARALRSRLLPLLQDACPFTPPPSGGWLRHNGRWVRPVLVAEVAFTEWTRGGLLRHPAFRGLREDRDPREVVRERAGPVTAASSARGGGAEVLGVAISHPDRVVDPGTRSTKLDLARYYEEVAPAMLPHVVGRPLTLFHCPAGLAGECRFMKHSKVWAPPAVRRVEIDEKRKRGEYLVIDTPQALLSVVQMDVLEVHTWNSRVGRLEEPDRIVLDLDPGPEVPWREVVGAAREVRAALDALRLRSFVKTTGGVGLHVVVPLAPRAGWRACLAFARGLATLLERHAPGRYTTTFTRRGRERKILVDYLRNNRTNTSVAAFSTRARPGLPVSIPLAWDELDPRSAPAWNVGNVPRRLRSLSRDPWAGYGRVRQDLSERVMRAVGGVPTLDDGRSGHAHAVERPRGVVRGGVDPRGRTGR